jgi:hypothetical protein
MADDQYTQGHMYDFGDGLPPRVWAGKKAGFVTKEKWQSMRGETQEQFDAVLDIRRRIDRAREIVAKHPSATGFFAPLMGGQNAPKWSPWQGWNGSPAKELVGTLAPVRASSAFQNMQEMRENAPTGASPVGQATDTDMQLLMNKDANLDVGLSKDHMLQELDASRRFFGRTQKGLTGQYPYDLRHDAPEDIPENAFFIGRDGLLYRNERGSGAPRGDGLDPRSMAPRQPQRQRPQQQQQQRRQPNPADFWE